MVVFYCMMWNETRAYSFIRYLGDSISDGDISWWAIPGTLED